MTVPPPLGAGDAHVWAVPLDVSREVADKLYTNLTDKERAQADSFRIDRPRRQFAYTRGALRTLLGRYLSERPGSIEFALEALAKPKLASKYNATGLRFNVSHSGELALIAITLGCDVGVDVEHSRMIRKLEELAQRYFHRGEIARVLATPAEIRNEVFLRCWTAKEAVLKAYGTGIAGCLAAFEVPLGQSSSGWVDLSALKQHDKSTACWLARLPAYENYTSSIAFVGHQRQVICLTFSIELE